MSESQMEAIRRNRAARKRKPSKLEPKSNRVRGESGGSGDSTYTKANTAFNYALFSGPMQGDARATRTKGANAVKKAVKRLKSKK